MHLLELSEVLEDASESEKVPIVLGGDDLEDLHAGVHRGGGDGVVHAASCAGDFAFALFVLAADALGGTEGCRGV